MTVFTPGNRHTILNAGRPGLSIRLSSDGYCVVTVIEEDNKSVELTLTLAIRDLFFTRLNINDGESQWVNASGVGNTVAENRLVPSPIFHFLVSRK